MKAFLLTWFCIVCGCTLAETEISSNLIEFFKKDKHISSIEFSYLKQYKEALQDYVLRLNHSAYEHLIDLQSTVDNQGGRAYHSSGSWMDQRLIDELTKYIQQRGIYYKCKIQNTSVECNQVLHRLTEDFNYKIEHKLREMQTFYHSLPDSEKRIVHQVLCVDNKNYVRILNFY